MGRAADNAGRYNRMPTTETDGGSRGGGLNEGDR